MVPRDGFITLAGCGIQKKRCPLSAPLLVGSRPTDGFQLAQFLLAEVEGTALPRKGHAPLKHKLVKLYRYLENDHLVTGISKEELPNALPNADCGNGTLNRFLCGRARNDSKPLPAGDSALRSDPVRMLA